MGGITSGTGLISGINTQALIEQLISVEGKPKLLAQRRLLELQSQQASLFDVNAKLGALRTAPGLGAVLTALVLAAHPISRHVGRWMFGGVALFGVSTIVFGLSTSFWLSFAALFLLGVGDVMSVVIRHMLVQLETPDAIRGRVSAVNAVFIGASNQLGEFRAGATAAALGAVGTVMLGAVGTVVVAALWWRLFPALAQRDALVAGR